MVLSTRPFLQTSVGLLKARARLSPSWSLRSIKTLQTFKLADIGEGITECEVIKWSIQPLARIEAFDPLCEVQSDKASVEITSPFDGVVKQILVQEGEVAKVGAGLCIIEVDDAGSADDAPAAAAAAAAPPPEPARPPPHLEQEKVSLSEESTPADLTPAEEQAPAPVRRPHPLDDNRPAGAPVPPAPGSDVLATPSVRHYARQHAVDLSRVAPGSGRGGRVERADVDAFLARGAEGASAPAPVHGKTPAAAPPLEDVVVELGRTRHAMWKAMEKSLEIPHFSYTTSLDITRLHALLPLLNAHIPEHFLPPPSSPPRPPAVSPSAFHPSPSPTRVTDAEQFTRLTYLPLLLKTLAKAMHTWPLFRSSLSPPSSSAPGAKPTLTLRPSADIAVALSTTTGLYTPVLTAVDRASPHALASRLARLAALGRRVPCALAPADLPRRGATLTVSNVGALGAGEAAAPVLVPGGGVAIVALGRARWVWDVDACESGERRLRLPVSWSADHRVVEGAELAAFVECWRGWVEAPERLVAEGV